MGKKATAIQLTDAQRDELVGWVNADSTQQRYVLRARMVLAAARGETSANIAAELGTRRATVSKWRTRFASQGLPGLRDAPRPGQPCKYDETTDQEIPAIYAKQRRPGTAPPMIVLALGGLLVVAAVLLIFLSPRRAPTRERRGGISWCSPPGRGRALAAHRRSITVP